MKLKIKSENEPYKLYKTRSPFSEKVRIGGKGSFAKYFNSGESKNKIDKKEYKGITKALKNAMKD